MIFYNPISFSFLLPCASFFLSLSFSLLKKVAWQLRMLFLPAFSVLIFCALEQRLPAAKPAQAGSMPSEERVLTDPLHHS